MFETGQIENPKAEARGEEKHVAAPAVNPDPLFCSPSPCSKPLCLYAPNP